MRLARLVVAAPSLVLTLLLAVAAPAAAQAPSEAASLDQALHESLNLWPLFSYDRYVSPAGNEVREQWDVMWPVFGVWQDEHREEAGFAALWPLIAGTWGPEHSHFRIAPFFGWWRWNNERAIALFPLGGGYWDDTSWSFTVPFFYSQNDAVTSRNVLFPFLWIFSEPKGGCVSFWPLWHAAWRTHTGASTSVLFDVASLSLLPVGAWHADRYGADTYWSVLWPLGPVYAAKGDAWGFRFLWEGFVAYSDGPDHLSWRLLGGLLARDAHYRYGQLEQEHWTVFWIFSFGVQHTVVRI